jgi:fluoroacetyl-CoA thioesterase
MMVRAEVELIHVDDRRLRFKVLCREDKELVCEGYHEWFIVETARFMSRLAKKAPGAS